MTYKKITIDKQFPAISDSWIKKQCKGVANFTVVNRPLTSNDLECIKKPTIIRIRPKGQDGANHTIFYTGIKDGINTETKDGINIGKIYDSWASTFADNGDIACRDYYDNKFMESNICTGKHTVNKEYFTPRLRQSHDQGICALCALYNAIQFSKGKIKTIKDRNLLISTFEEVLKANCDFKIEPRLDTVVLLQ